MIYRATFFGGKVIKMEGPFPDDFPQTDDELEAMRLAAEETENYERAALIRDEIARRKEEI